VEASVATTVTNDAVRANVRGMKGWLKFMGIIQIVGGAINALSIVGILWAWLPIWLGIVLVQAGSRAGEYADRNDVTSLAALTGKLKTYFTISGIVMMISIALGVIGGIIWAILLAAGMFSLPGLLDSLRSGNFGT
jgi:hypothetical protein